MNINKANRDNNYDDGNDKNSRKATSLRDWNSNSSNKEIVGQRRVKLKAHHRKILSPAGMTNGGMMNRAKTVDELDPFNYTKGVLLTKVHKSASSTMSGITLQILLQNKCSEGNIKHQAGAYYGNRDKSRSFMFAPIRDPASRAISLINYKMI